MADYTYKELMKMQNDAIRRVEDMQKRARKTAGIENIKEEKDISPEAPRRIPQPSGYLNNGNRNNEEFSQKINVAPRNTKSDSISEKIKNTIEELNIDSDKALLLSLIMLLSEEGGDELLIMALIYMLN